MNDIYEVYNIENGDTLYDISRKFNINPELLALINGLNLNDYIYTNQKILIPKKEFSYYLSKENDNLNDILTVFKTDYNSFLEYNNKILLEEGQIFAYKR